MDAEEDDNDDNVEGCDTSNADCKSSPPPPPPSFSPIDSGVLVVVGESIADKVDTRSLVDDGVTALHVQLMIPIGFVSLMKNNIISVEDEEER